MTKIALYLGLVAILCSFSYADLVLNMTFQSDEGAVAVDYSPAGNNGTVNGATWSSYGVTDGGALDFDASGDYIILENSAGELYGDSDATVMMWIRTDSLSSRYFFTHARTGTPGNRFYMSTSDGDNLLDVRVGSCSEDDAYDLGTGWHHVVLMRNGTQVELYVDEALENMDTGCTYDDTSTDIYVGSYDDGGTAFNGTLDQVKIYNYAVDYSTIQSVYNTEKLVYITGVTATASSPAEDTDDDWTITHSGTNDHYNTTWFSTADKAAVLVMDFNVPNATDLSGNGNHGTVHANMQWGENSGYDGSGSYYADETSRIYDIPRIDFDTNKDFTVMGWYKGTNVGADAGDVFIDQRDANDDGWRIVFGNIGIVYASIDTVDAVTTTTVFDDKWHHITATFDRDENVTIYIDSINSATQDLSNENMSTTQKISIMGTYYASLYTEGYVDDVRIYNYSLTPEQIYNIYANSSHVLDSEETSPTDTWTGHWCGSNGISYDCDSTSFTIASLILTHTPVSNVIGNPATISYSVNVNSDCSIYLDGSITATQSNMTPGTTYTTNLNLTQPISIYSINCTDIVDGTTAATANYTIYLTSGLPVYFNQSICNISFVEYSEYWMLQQFFCEKYINSTAQIYGIGREVNKTMVLAIIILLPLIVGITLLFGAAQMGNKHAPLKIFMYLLVPVFFWISLNIGMIATVKFFDFPELQEYIGWVTWVTGILFGVLIAYWAIYFIYVAFNAHREKKQEELEY